MHKDRKYMNYLQGLGGGMGMTVYGFGIFWGAGGKMKVIGFKTGGTITRK